jgi:tetratricopeptide (TPR) repeat protein
MPGEWAKEKANVLLGEAVLLRAKGKTREALEKTQESLRVLADNPDAFEILGDLYSAVGLPEAAMEAYQRALELDPSRITLETRLAHIALKKSEIDYQRRLAQDLIAGRYRPLPKRNPGIAGILSLLIPGMGQIYNQHWLKGGIVLCGYLLLAMKAMSAVASILKTAGSGDMFALIAGFFARPALAWTILLLLLYSYATIDAAVAATRSASEESGLI